MNRVLLWNFVQVCYFYLNSGFSWNSGGSLYNVLEEPEYIYGLKENDLRKLIRDVTAGMSYLREKDIIHRDIKPGNILLSDKSDDSCWKLTDFGAARQLQPEQQFQVLFGEIKFKINFFKIFV